MDHLPRPDGPLAKTADIHFRPKARRCGKCGLWFTTCPQFRFFGPCCRGFWKSAKPEVREVRAGVGNRYVSSE